MKWAGGNGRKRRLPIRKKDRKVNKTRENADDIPLAAKVVVHYDRLAAASPREKIKSGYYRELARLVKHLVLPGQRVLDVGCGTGELLRTLRPGYGLGIDISPKMIETARERSRDCPHLHYAVGDGCREEVFRDLDEKFDVICAVGVIHEMEDVLRFLKGVRHCCSHKTRLLLVNYSRLWQWPVRLAEGLGLKTPHPVENWLSPDVMKELLYAADFQPILDVNHLLCPFPLGPVSRFINRYLGHIPPLVVFSMLRAIVARPVGKLESPGRSPNPSCSVVIPCRNEQGHIRSLAARLPELPQGSEVIWIEGNSTDNTEEEIKKVIEENPGRPFRFIKQMGKGKGDAVRTAFTEAKGEIVLILDADITVPPEDILKFVSLLAERKAEFVNGTRMVYPMHKRAMRFLNLLGNKSFALTFRFLLGQPVSDTLCGTKAMWREDYEQLARNRSYFGDFDPFGDFDLLLGAARMHLKIFNLPVRYGQRTYGETNISRFTHGWLLLKMSVFAARKNYFI